MVDLGETVLCWCVDSSGGGGVREYCVDVTAGVAWRRWWGGERSTVLMCTAGSGDDDSGGVRGVLC